MSPILTPSPTGAAPAPGTNSSAHSRRWAQVMVMAGTLALVACGGGGGGGEASPPPPPPPPPPPAPTITAQPTASAAVLGQPVTFSIGASGTGTLSYQWKRDGVAITGATSASYTLPSVTLWDDQSVFTVEVKNDGTAATSNGATLSVSPPAAGPLQMVAQAGSVPMATLSVPMAAGGGISGSTTNLVAVTATGSSLSTVENAGAWLPWGVTVAEEAQVSGGAARTTSNFRTRLTTYFKGSHLYVLDVSPPAGTAVAPRQWSSVSTTSLCNSTVVTDGDSNYLRRASDLDSAWRSWRFVLAPGADGVCDTADDTYLGLRFDMDASLAPVPVNRPLTVLRDSGGVITGFLVANGTRVQRVNAKLAGATDLFTANNAPTTLRAVFGNSAPGVWLFKDGNDIRGYKLDGSSATPTTVYTLAAGESVMPDQSRSASDGADQYLLITSGSGATLTSKVLRVNQALGAATVSATFTHASTDGLQIHGTTTNKVILTVTNASGVGSLLAVDKAAGGAVTSIGTQVAGEALQRVILSGDNVWLHVTSSTGTGVRMRLVNETGGNAQVFEGAEPWNELKDAPTDWLVPRVAAITVLQRSADTAAGLSLYVYDARNAATRTLIG